MNRAGAIKLVLCTAGVVIACILLSMLTGCRALGFDYGPCIFCTTTNEVKRTI